MITAAAIHHGDAARFLRYNTVEHPLAIQLGGSDPVLMAKAFKQAVRAGRRGYLAGKAAVSTEANASSPLTGFLRNEK